MSLPTPTSIAELQHALGAAGVNPSSYSFVSDCPGDVFRLAEFHDELGRGWYFYYTERGLRRGEVRFRDEAEACTFFLERVLAASGTRHADRPTMSPNPALERTPTGGDAGGASHVRPRQ